MSTSTQTTPSDRLRFVLQANAAFSFVSGVVALVAGSWVSEQLGIDHVLITRVLGAGLIVFAGDVVFVSRRPELNLLTESALVSIADFTWVAGTAVVLLAGVLNTTGAIVATVVAVAVADFGTSQLWFRSKTLGATSRALATASA